MQPRANSLSIVSAQLAASASLSLAGSISLPRRGCGPPI
jgi:hypothetical protein